MDVLINIDVPELEPALTFYRAAFGLTVGRRFDGAVELIGLPAPIYLLEKPPGSAASPAADEVRRYVRHWTPVHLDLVVDNLDAALGRALTAGATLERGPKEAAWGRLALLADPFGHGLCLIEFTGIGYDAIALPAAPRS